MAKKTTKTGKELERQVADAYRAIGARRVKHDVELAGHQIDVYVEMETADRSLHRIAVEAKDYGRPVGIQIVHQFGDVVDTLRRLGHVDEGVIVSTAGFSRPGRNAAQEHGLRLLEPADLQLVDEPVITNKDVINAFFKAAGQVGENGWSWLNRAGLADVVNRRQWEYRGPAIDDLTGLTAEEKANVKAILTPLSFIWVGPTDNCDRGRFGHQIEMIIISFSAGDITGVVSLLKNPQSRVSAHYIIDHDGKILQLVKDGDTAWHFGLPGYERDDAIQPDRRSIGIQLTNWGRLEKRDDKYYNWMGKEHRGQVVVANGWYWEPYTEPQYESLIELISYLCKRYSIPIRYPPLGPGVYHERTQDLVDFKGILGHSAVNIGKSDPGPHFDWDRWVA